MKSLPTSNMGFKEEIYLSEIAYSKSSTLNKPTCEWCRSVAQYLVNLLHNFIGELRQDGEYVNTLQYLAAVIAELTFLFFSTQATWPVTCPVVNTTYLFFIHCLFHLMF
jgi:hypothetical protein